MRRRISARPNPALLSVYAAPSAGLGVVATSTIIIAIISLIVGTAGTVFGVVHTVMSGRRQREDAARARRTQQAIPALGPELNGIAVSAAQAIMGDPQLRYLTRARLWQEGRRELVNYLKAARAGRDTPQPEEERRFRQAFEAEVANIKAAWQAAYDLRVAEQAAARVAAGTDPAQIQQRNYEALLAQARADTRFQRLFDRRHLLGSAAAVALVATLGYLALRKG